MALNNHNNFLQSDIWRKFQEAVGHKTFTIKEGNFSASIIEHELPIVGKYFYIPRGPILCHPELVSGSNKLDPSTTLGMTNVVDLAKKNKANWIRIDSENKEALNSIIKNTGLKIQKSPHDMQPKEILVIDITKSEEELLAGMKSKTRYNIKLAEKHGVKVFNIGYNCHPELISGSNELDSGSGAGMTTRYINEFVRLIKLTEKRKGIKFHSAKYYQKMLETIPSNILKLYVAEYNGKIIAANLVIFFGDAATYLHGATDDEYRNVMAPYLLQWKAIKDAKAAGYAKYDFGGIKSEVQNSKFKIQNYGNWSGITKFKLGFAPITKPIIFSGSYDIIIDRKKYYLYRIIQKMKCWIS